MKISIQTKVLTTAILLILLTTISISVAYYILRQQEARQESQQKIEIALDLTLNDLEQRHWDVRTQMKNFLAHNQTLHEAAQGYNADPERLHSGPFLLAYFQPSVEQLKDLGAAIWADRLLLYGADKRLLLVYQRTLQQAHVGGYLITQNGADTFFPMDDSSDVSLMLLGAAQSDIPEQPLPAGIPPQFNGVLPLMITTQEFREGRRLGFRVTAPLFREQKVIGVVVGEIFYTQQMVETYARLSKTEVNLFAENAMSLGTLQSYDRLPPESIDQMIPCQQIQRQAERHVLSVTIDRQEYYQGQCTFTDTEGATIGAITINLSQRIEKEAMHRTVAAIMTIALVTIEGSCRTGE